MKFLSNHPTLQRYFTSSLTTFLTAFLGMLTIELGNGVTLQFTGVFWFSLLTVAVRAGIKAVVESFTTTHADPAPIS
jgi:hypothetical protein